MMLATHLRLYRQLVLWQKSLIVLIASEASLTNNDERLSLNFFFNHLRNHYGKNLRKITTAQGETIINIFGIIFSLFIIFYIILYYYNYNITNFICYSFYILSILFIIVIIIIIIAH